MTVAFERRIEQVLSRSGAAAGYSETACWRWLGWIDPSTGYGRQGMRYAHRVSYEMKVGPIPPGLHIDHLCRNRACVNPSHLEAVTPGENQRRGWLARRSPTCPKGHARWGTTKTGARYCLECGRLRMKEWAAARPRSARS